LFLINGLSVRSVQTIHLRCLFVRECRQVHVMKRYRAMQTFVMSSSYVVLMTPWDRACRRAIVAQGDDWILLLNCPSGLHIWTVEVERVQNSDDVELDSFET